MKIKSYLKQVDLFELLEKLGIKNLQSKSSNIMASCPFHDDNNPSFSINKHTGGWQCFTCNASNGNGSGGLIDLVRRIRGVNVKQAIRWLYNIVGIKQDIEITPRMVKKQIKNTLNKDDNIYNKEHEDKYILRATIPRGVRYDWYLGIKYFEGRKIAQRAVRVHQITFCTQGYYKNRAIIPIKDANGKLISFEARDITSMAEKKVLYPKDVVISQTLFNIHMAKEHNSVIIVEGIMDALYLNSHGFNAVALFGVNLSQKQENLLSKHFDTVYICLDMDAVGYKSMKRLANRLSLHLKVYIITLPVNKDPDDIEPEDFKKYLDKAKLYTDFFIGTCKKAIIKKIKKNS